jgi:hypothetical protein
VRDRLPRRPRSAIEVLAECRRAEEEFARLECEGLEEVKAELSSKEVRHLTHTVYRINGLLYLYDHLRGARHHTRLGVLLGSITYLLDYAYDHVAKSTLDVEPFERLVMLQGAPVADTPVARSLSRLAREMWQLADNKGALRERLSMMLETQRLTMAQSVVHPMPNDELESLTYEKGHRSLCLYFAAVNPVFGPDEAHALRKFGLYMQYMDDLEDFYEDLAERRQSPVPSPARGVLRATTLLRRALPELRRYYEASADGRYSIVATWIVLYHASIISACATREITRRLPSRVRLWADGFSERRAATNPLFHAAPVGLSYLDPPRDDPGSGDEQSLPEQVIRDH